MDALPDKGVVFQVGMMLARNSAEPSIRLCTSMPLHLYPQFLLDIGWLGSINDLEDKLQTFEPYVDAVFVDIDVGESLGIPIGLECGYRKGTHTEPRIKSFLSFLTKEQLSTPENGNFIQEWIQGNQVPVIFDFDLEKMQFHQSLSHIKIILNPDRSLKAKAYLSFSRRAG